LAIMVRSRVRFGAGPRFLAALGLVALVGSGVEAPYVSAGSANPATALGSPTVSTEVLGGADTSAVSVAVSQRLFPDGGASVAYLVAAQSYADGLGAGPIAAHEGGAILYTAGASLTAAVGQELVRLAPARVKVLGGTDAIDPTVVDQVTALLAPATVVERVAGPGAAGIAAALSAASFAPGAAATVFVAGSASVAIAIAAGAVAAHAGAPLLLTDATSLPAATAAELQRLAPQHVVVVGGTGSVSAAVLTAIDALVPSVERVSAADDYATAAALAARYLPGAATAVVVGGPAGAPASASGLAAVPLAAVRAAPILYTTTDDLLPTPTRDRLVATHPTRIVIVGSVSEVTRAQLVGFSDGRLAVPPATPSYPSGDAAYHDPGEMLQLIRATEIAYPSIVHVFSIGKSYEGRDIWAAKISDNVSIDENEPEVLIDALHHADEHLGVEQALYLLATLTSQYATDPYIRGLVDGREVWIIFAVNPDGWAYDLSGGAYKFWRKNRQPYGGNVGTDINRNYSYRFGCCGGSSSKSYYWNFRGPAAFSTPEAAAVRNFVASRVVGGVQQIKTHVTLHTNGQLILYPYGYTKTIVPSDMTLDDHNTFAYMAQTMARMNGYKAEQSSSLYITDGDEIDWMYHEYHIFSFTFELYPVDQATLAADVYPPYSIVATQTARNKGALLYLIQAAGCPYVIIGKAAQYCSGSPTDPPPSFPSA
jgi:putative cell wall-binding protein